jgi:diguanylate cyclase (GGDEF)-like protein
LEATVRPDSGRALRIRRLFLAARAFRRAPIADRRPMSRTLRLSVAVIVLLGYGLLALVTIRDAVDPAITIGLKSTALGNSTAGSLLFWIVLGLLGSTRTQRDEHAVLTFHLPFVVAAMMLGGPVAAGWVGLVSTIELREIRQVPWIGVLHNHAVAALGGVAAGVVGVLLRARLGPLLDPQAAAFVAGFAASFVFCAINIGLTVGTVAMRDDMSFGEAASAFDRSFRQTTIAEVILGWVLAITYTAIGWWAPIVCIVLVLLAWRATDEHEVTTHDPMTGLLNRRGFEARWAQAVWRVQRGRQKAALLMVDLDGFKAINDTFGHDAGDDVIRAAGARLRGAIRFTDAAARLGGDEFAVLLTGVRDRDATASVASRIHADLCAPVVIDSNSVNLGASVGVAFLDADTAETAQHAADLAMFEAKRRGGGIEHVTAGIAAVT